MDLNSGLTQVLSDGTYDYLYGNGRISQTHLTPETAAPEYFLTDALGSVRQLTDATGKITLVKAYDPYGVASLLSGAGSTSYGYTGEQQDSGGMVYLRARYYDPAIGRFTQKDPSRLEANLYLYAGSNPINRRDPSGLFSPTIIASSYGFNSFDKLLDAFDKKEESGRRWGWLALLLDAKPGDSFTGLYPDIGNRVLFSERYNGVLDIGSSNSIYRNSILVSIVDWWHSDIFSNENVYNYYNMQGWSEGMASSMAWRDSSPHVYKLSNGPMYIDYAWEQTDLPDFHSISGSIPGVGVSGGLSLIVDYFGNVYLGGSAGAGVGGGINYNEGYITPDVYDDVVLNARRRITDESQLINIMSGLCSTISINAVAGISIGMCPYDTGSALGIAGIAVYSAGAAFNFSDEFNFTRPIGYKNPNLGWEWAFSYRRNGWTKAKVKAKTLLQSGVCP